MSHRTKIKVWAELVHFGGSRGKTLSFFWQILAAANFLWLVSTSLQSLVHIAFSSTVKSSYNSLLWKHFWLCSVPTQIASIIPHLKNLWLNYIWKVSFIISSNIHRVWALEHGYIWEPYLDYSTMMSKYKHSPDHKYNQTSPYTG